MDVSYFPKHGPRERDGTERGSEPTPLVPLVMCILAVSLMIALVQVSWASPVLGGTALLVVVAALRNRFEEAREDAAGEAPACPQTLLAPSGPDEEKPEPPARKSARTDRRFRGDRLWGLN